MFDIGPNNTIVIKEVEVLMIKDFNKLWVRDKSKDKSQAYKDFAYIYFKNDFKSPYRNSFSEEEIDEVLIIDLDLGKDWSVTPLLKAAEEKYIQLQTTKSLKMLIAAERAMEQITLYFNTYDVGSIPEEKKADSIKKLMDNLKNVDDVVGRLESAKRKVAEELITQKISGGKKLSSRELPKSKRR